MAAGDVEFRLPEGIEPTLTYPFLKIRYPSMGIIIPRYGFRYPDTVIKINTDITIPIIVLPQAQLPR